MKKTFKIIFFVSLATAVLSGGLFVLSFVLPLGALAGLSAFPDQSASIGIIGGADGPTAVLISRTVILENPLFWVLCVSVILLAASAVGLIVMKRK